MADFTFTSPEGKSYTVTGPEGATKEQAWQILQQHISEPKPESRLERIGHGLADPALGAAQLGARLEEPGAEMGAALVPGGVETYQEEKAGRAEAIDKMIREREAAIQARRPIAEQGTTDWLRLAGSIPTTIALAPGGPSLPGAVLGGALGGAIQPEIDTENFATHKAISAGLGAVGGAIGSLAIKGGGALYQTIRNPESNAIASLARATERDGTTIEQLQQRLREVRTIRPDATLADVSGENVRGLVERIGQTPGAGVAKLAPRMTERQQQQLGRISGDLANLTGTSRTAFEATNQTIAAREAEASPLYRQAYAEGNKAIWSDELERLTSADEVKQAMQIGVNGWRRSQVAAGYGALNPRAISPAETGILRIPTGRIPVFPDLQFWDYTKTAIDDMIADEIRPDGTISRKGRDLTVIVGRMRNELDQQVPSYRAARETWGGRSEYLNSIEEGRSILSRSVSSEEMAAQFGQKTEANKEAYRIGATSAIRAQMGSDPAKLVDLTKYLRSPEMRVKLAAMMPSPEAGQRWLQSLDYEVRASELTGQALKGSATARRLAQQTDADTLVGDLVLTAITPHHSTLGFLKAFLGNLPKKAKDTLRSRSDNILIDILTTPEGAESASKRLPTSGTTSLMTREYGTIPRVTNPAAELAAGPLAAGAGGALAPNP